MSERYRTIVADPPWPYDNETWGIGAIGDGYETLSFEDICSLPVAQFAAREAHLYLWVTNAKLLDHDYAALVNAWGFSYKTLLTWRKTACLGIGHYFRGETEHVLFCTRGRLPIEPASRERNHFDAPRGRHSAKPDAFYDLVERVSPGPRLELFARRQRLGWDTWGNEALQHVTMEVAP
jgi:N6-adenosine-specific RNA methylase IME4